MKKLRQPQFFLPNNPLAPKLCPELAKEIGLNESILLLQWEFWMRLDGVERDGHIWLRRTVREIQHTFSFWGIGTVHRTLKSLESEGYIVAGEYDEQSGKNTPWFRFDFDRLTLIKSIRIVFQDGTDLVPEYAKPFQIGTSVLIDKDQRINTGAGEQEKPRKKEMIPEPPFRGAAFLTALKRFEDSRKERKKPLVPTQRLEIYEKMAIWGEEVSTQALKKSTSSGYPDVYYPGTNGNGYGNGAGIPDPAKCDPDRPMWMAGQRKQ